MAKDILRHQIDKKVRMSRKGIDTEFFFPAEIPFKLSLYKGSPEGNKVVNASHVTITTRPSRGYWNTRVFYSDADSDDGGQICLRTGCEQNVTLGSAAEAHYAIEKQIESNYMFPNNPLAACILGGRILPAKPIPEIPDLRE